MDIFQQKPLNDIDLIALVGRRNYSEYVYEILTYDNLFIFKLEI